MENQDYVYSAQNDDAAFFAVADGVSACKKSRIGAQIACEVSAEILLDHAEYYFDASQKKVISLVMTNIREALKKQAASDGCDMDDYASTLCFVCYLKRDGRVMLFSLGDSRIYRVSRDAVTYVNRTQSHAGNTVCSTISLRAEKEAVLSRKTLDEEEKFLLCTDGAWRTAEQNDLFARIEDAVDGSGFVDSLLTSGIRDDYSVLLAS